MIFLHTGLPGAGKTLYTLWHLKDLAEKEGRQVYYFNIPEVKIPGWIEIDEAQFLKWFELPANSIIVGDEAQRVFRPRAASSKVPDHVAKLETHRHLGVDLYLITQHPGLIDLNVRKLVGTHRHVVRSFGARHAVIHSWSQCKDNCDKSRKDSVKSQFRYPKEVFNWYKSAEVHTHKRKIPLRVFVLVATPLVILGAGYYAYKGLTVDAVERSKAGVAKALGHDVGQGALLDSGGGAGAARPMTQAEYLVSLSPRVPDLAYTAPRYDSITVPVDAPFPVACVESPRSGCRCYTQQQTRYKSSVEFCRNFVRNGGVFRDWAVAEKKSEDRAPVGSAPQVESASLSAG